MKFVALICLALISLGANAQTKERTEKDPLFHRYADSAQFFFEKTHTATSVEQEQLYTRMYNHYRELASAVQWSHRDSTLFNPTKKKAKKKN